MFGFLPFGSCPPGVRALEFCMLRFRVVALSNVAWLSILASGCALEPSEACVQYVACQKHYDDVYSLETADLDETFGPEGLCWRDDQSATSCTSTCEVATARLAEGLDAADDDLGPCAP